jgi:hypothetical protein
MDNTQPSPPDKDSSFKKNESRDKIPLCLSPTAGSRTDGSDGWRMISFTCRPYEAGWSLKKFWISSAVGNRTPIIQPLVRPFTDRAIPTLQQRHYDSRNKSESPGIDHWILIFNMRQRGAPVIT